MEGTIIDGKYEVLRQLGEGGMGAVHEARHKSTGRKLAIKVIVPAALAELQRQLFPTRDTTKNTAIAMRKVGRYGESLDLFETLIRDYKLELSLPSARSPRKSGSCVTTTATCSGGGALHRPRPRHRQL